eukprot:TRINITY_DN1140_c0_g1_i1.p1 TRINITY_DN1140_c0_g1~~TRINITY_DN1140_c0_g1_i1.p1  ORF type:complete len:310 (+),score=144.36 TRINITY_DN1140_c0_g1_i1:47-976(+)
MASKAIDEEIFFAGIETGGTHVVVGISQGTATNIIHKQEFATTTPTETITNCIQWLKDKKFSSFGLASFGPVDLDTSSSTYGYITTTPKPNWGNIDILGQFRNAFPNCAFAFDTDVNAAAIGQHDYSAQHTTSCCYITVGTGIGVGIVIGGQPLHGLLHPEAGHMFVAKAKGDENFEGTCPYHGHCVEGMASAGSIAKRKQIQPNQLAQISDDDPVWPIIAHYLGSLCANLALTVSPHQIVFGGGVLQRKILYPLIRQKTKEILAGYLACPKILNNIEEYIIESPFGVNAGLVGAMALAKRAHDNQLNK